MIMHAMKKTIKTRRVIVTIISVLREPSSFKLVSRQSEEF